MIFGTNRLFKITFKSKNLFDKLRDICFRDYMFPRICFLLTISLLFFLEGISAQVGQDSVIIKDSIHTKSESPAADDSSIKPVIPQKRIAHIKKDSVIISPADSSLIKKTQSYSQAETLAHYPIDSIPFKYKSIYESDQEGIYNKTVSFNEYFNFLGESEKAYEKIHTTYSYDGLFYLLVGILFYFALVKVLFGKYMTNLFTLFFRASMRQQQIREQVLQSPLPSLSLNILFIIVGGLYGAFIVKHYQLAVRTDFWLMFINFSGLICIIYLIKFLLLKSAGWIFNIQGATDTYIFIIFLTNKILGIFILPFLIILSFSGSLLNEIAITISVIMILAFFLYRCIASYAPLRKEIKMNGFHFFLYLCAFEIAPLLLIYRVLLSFLENA
jgi:hypothetical protein